VIENGALPLLVDFTKNRSIDLKEQVKKHCCRKTVFFV